MREIKKLKKKLKREKRSMRPRITHVNIDGEQVPVQDVRFACPACDKANTNRTTMQRHFVTHHTDEEFIKWKPTIDSLPKKKEFMDPEGHPLARKGKPKLENNYNYLFKCSMCDKKSISTLAALKEHVLLVHNGENLHELDLLDEKPYKCDRCESKFQSPTLLAVHVRDVHHNFTESFPCEYCAQMYDTPKRLKGHVDTVHKNRYTYKCGECDKIFKSKANFMSHTNSHRGLKPFICEYCSKSFTSKALMTNHKRYVHLNDRIHKCHLCEKAFVDKYNLKNHIEAIHLKIRRFTCDNCTQTFSCNGNKRKHMLKAHGIKI